MTTHGRAGDHRGLAVLLILGAVACASTQDALLKWISGGYPVHELVAIRCVLALPILLGLVVFGPGLPALATRKLGLVLLRGLVLCTAYLSYILAIVAIPIADAVAIYFTMPFFVAGLAGPFLGERVPLYRWLAIIAGFSGVLIMNGLGRGAFAPAAIFALISALGYAVGQMMGRPLSKEVPPVVMAFYQNLVYFAVAIGLALLFSGHFVVMPADKSFDFLIRPWIVPPAADYLALAVLGILGALAMPLFSNAYKYAEANFVAPFEYSSMIWALTYGILVFHDIPGWKTAIGGGIVVGAGLFMLAMDRRRARAGRVAP